MSADTQIKSIYERWERLEGEKKAISDDLKELFAESKLAGYDGKALRIAFNRKAKMDAATTADEHFDAVVDTYLDALNGSPRDARLRTRENIEEFDAETGEVRDTKSPREAAEAVSESTAQFQANANDEACETGSDQTRAEASADASDGVELVSRVVDGRTSTATSERMDETDRRDDHLNFETCERCQGNGEIVTDWDRYKHPHEGDIGDEAVAECPDCGGEGIIDTTEFAPASQGEAEAPSVESAEPGILAEDTRSDANTGGDHVTASENAATHQAGSGLVSEPRPAAHPVLVIRPHCQHPGEAICGGSGRQHCRACAAAMREEEVA